MSSLISSADFCHSSARSASSRISASRAPRSSATQHISLDDVKCFGSPRTSQRPRSGSLPVGQRVLDLLHQDRPDPLRQVVARLGVQVEGVEHGAPHVVLLLVVRAVADAHGAGALVAREVVQRLLHQLRLAVDAVHDLELALLGLGHVGDEVEEVVGLPVEAERVQAPERERGVADPACSGSPSCARRRASRAARWWPRPPSRRWARRTAPSASARCAGGSSARGGRETRRGRASAASGGRSTPAARRPRRSSSAAGARTTTAPRTACRPPSSSCARWRAGPRSPGSCRVVRRSWMSLPAAVASASW